ncbi:MAG: hypothetical protein SFV20_03730 [Sphingopyxis sp.]|nr:hypothetical protein [Sphingopyxis sp.]
MIARRPFVALLAGAALAGLTGCISPPKHRYRFKMMIEVETPDGIRSGSSVYEVTAQDLQALLPDEADRKWSTKGEAVAVDLPDGVTLFALLKTGAMHGDMASLSMAALDPAFNNDVVESAERISTGHGIISPAIVKRSDYPMLVWFPDINDPRSVAQVDPGDLQKSFGAGYRLKAITVQVTDEPVSTGIEKRLDAIGFKPHAGLDPSLGVTASPTLAQQLGKDDFVWR